MFNIKKSTLFREVAGVFVKVGSTWSLARQAYVNIGGIWTLVGEQTHRYADDFTMGVGQVAYRGNTEYVSGLPLPIFEYEIDGVPAPSGYEASQLIVNFKLGGSSGTGIDWQLYVRNSSNVWTSYGEPYGSVINMADPNTNYEFTCNFPVPMAFTAFTIRPSVIPTPLPSPLPEIIWVDGVANVLDTF